MNRRRGEMGCRAAVLGAVVLGCWGLALRAEEIDPAAIDALMKRIDALTESNEALQQRVTDLEKRLAEQETQPPADVTPKTEETDESGAKETRAPDAGTQQTPLDAYWDRGICLATPDERFKLRIGGRVLVDVAAFDNPDYWELGGPTIDEEDDAQLRSLRLKLSGRIYDRYLFCAEADFADEDVEIKDAFVGMDGIPVLGTVRAGKFTEPFGLEQLTSTTNVTFAERSMVTEAFAPYRAVGLGVSNSLFGDRATWSVGTFRRKSDDETYWDFTGRITGLPWYADDGRRLLHVGAAISHQTPRGFVEFASAPESQMGNRHMNTGGIPVESDVRWGFETALVFGPFAIQSEYMAVQAEMMPPARTLTLVDVDKFLQQDRRFDGFYVQASYLLTGEHRPYNKKEGYFERVLPRHPFELGMRGWGAWEIALRYSELDLNNADIRSGVIGGEGRNWTAGVNWYATANTRLTLNYIRAHVDQRAYDGDIDIIQGRFQVDF